MMGMPWMLRPSGGAADTVVPASGLALMPSAAWMSWQPEARAPASARATARGKNQAVCTRGILHLADDLERDDERVDHQRLDQREAENHRDEELAGRRRVAGDAVERRRRCAALTERAAEGRDRDADAGRE